MAEENKQTSNVIRPEPTKNLPNEKEGDFKSFIKSLFGVKQTDILKSIDQSISEISAKLAAKYEDDGDRRESVDKVSIHSFSEDALKQLNLRAVDEKPDTDEKKVDSNNLGFLEQVLKAAVPLIIAGGAFIASVGEIFKGGPLHGLGTLFAKGSVAAAFLALKGVGINVLGKLPIVGGIISIGSGILRLTRGDFFGGIVDFISGLLYLTPLWPLGVALDLFNMAVDMGETNPDALSGWAGKAVQAKTAISNFFKTHGRNLPIVGTVIRLGEAIGYFSVGQIQAGFKSISGALFALGGGGMAFDWLFGAADPWAEDGSNLGNISNIGKIIKNHIAEKILHYFPEALGIRSRVAKLLGINYNDNIANEMQLLKNESQIESLQARSGRRPQTRSRHSSEISRLQSDNARIQFEEGVIDRDEYAYGEIERMMDMPVGDSRRIAIRDNLLSSGFEGQELREIAQMVRENSEIQRQMLEREQNQSSENPNVISNVNNNVSNTHAIFNHDTRSKISDQRNQHNPYFLKWGYAGS
jgi:hypothetical protein